MYLVHAYNGHTLIEACRRLVGDVASGGGDRFEGMYKRSLQSGQEVALKQFKHLFSFSYFLGQDHRLPTNNLLSHEFIIRVGRI